MQIFKFMKNVRRSVRSWPWRAKHAGKCALRGVRNSLCLLAAPWLKPTKKQVEKLGSYALDLSKAATVGFAIKAWEALQFRVLLDWENLAAMGVVAVVFYVVGIINIRRSE